MTNLQIAMLAILDNPLTFDWSVQGFGMLRLYVRDIGRIHVWDSALRYPGVSMIHNHSWDLSSIIVFGCIKNTRFRESAKGDLYNTQRIVTGYQTRTVSEVQQVRLEMQPTEYYRKGMTYMQRAAEIHRTDAEDGSVSLMQRKEDDHGQADIYWPNGGTWGTAKPRAATQEEILRSTRKVLEAIS